MFNNNYRIIIGTSSASGPVFLERQRESNREWYFIGLIEPAEQLSDPDNYMKIRIVSSALTVKSATVSGLNTYLNGTISAVRLD